MEHLVRGLHRFQTVTFRRHGELFRRLADEQKPEVLFVACADSRYSPNLITGAKPGEIFILRNAGNFVPPYGERGDGWNEAGTIEYAVEALGVRHIVVCGHTRCGAVKGVLHPEAVAHMPAVARCLEAAARTRELVTRHYRDLDGDALWDVAAEEHVLEQVENLSSHPCIQRHVESGELSMYAWIYEMHTGQTHQYVPDQDDFVPCTSLEAAKARALAGRLT